MAVKITFSQSGWTSTQTYLYLDTSTDKCYSDSACTTEINSVPIPTRTSTTATSGYKFLGYWSTNAATGTQYIGEDGAILDTLRALTAAKTIYCPSVVYSYKITLNDSSGSGGSGSFWRIKTATTSNYFFTEQECVTPISKVTPPTRAGYTFAGYYNAASKSGTQYIDASGNILSALSSLTAAAKTIYAGWTGLTYTLTFDYNGGTGSTESMTVTMGSAIGTLPTATRDRSIFKQWELNGTKITADTVWSTVGDGTAVANWTTIFGTVTDWFGLASANLIPESSDSGDTHQHTCAYNATSEAATTETSGIWRNPRVTYRVVGQMTLNVTLGAAFEAVNSNLSMPTVSGYMITAVEVHTAVGEAPTVTVSAVANEGFTQRQSGSTTYYTATATPAIQTYAVSLAISPRHRPQNLMSALNLTNHGELQELTLVAKADPVVIAENGMPCASDICHGCVEVTARTAAYNNESAPVAANSFVLTSEPYSNSGTGYKTWNVTARKELS